MREGETQKEGFSTRKKTQGGSSRGPLKARDHRERGINSTQNLLAPELGAPGIRLHLPLRLITLITSTANRAHGPPCLQKTGRQLPGLPEGTW